MVEKKTVIALGVAGLGIFLLLRGAGAEQEQGFIGGGGGGGFFGLPFGGGGGEGGFFDFPLTDIPLFSQFPLAGEGFDFGNLGNEIATFFGTNDEDVAFVSKPTLIERFLKQSLPEGEREFGLGNVNEFILTPFAKQTTSGFRNFIAGGFAGIKAERARKAEAQANLRAQTLGFLKSRFSAQRFGFTGGGGALGSTRNFTPTPQNIGDPFIRDASGRAIGSKQPIGRTTTGGFIFG